MPYSLIALCSVILFSFVHLFASKTRQLNPALQGKILSTGGGVAIAYVFVDLLPKLAKNEPALQSMFSGLFPYFERHVYVMALLGFVLFYLVDRSQQLANIKAKFWLSIGSYALFNFMVGYAVCDKDDPEVKPLVLFTIAMGLHYFVNDFSLSVAHPQTYGHRGRWILILSLFLGWFVGLFVKLPQASVALVSAFIAGGVIMNVTRHELPADNPHSVGAFLWATFVYTALLLAIG